MAVEFVPHFYLSHILSDHLWKCSFSFVKSFFHVNSFFVFVEGDVSLLAKFRQGNQLFVARLNTDRVRRHTDVFLGLVVLISLRQTKRL